MEKFIITRIFDAPREKMWQAWTEPKSFTQWFGPKGCSSEIKILDLRPGGILHSRLKISNIPEMWAKFIYRDISPHEKLSWEHSFSDKDGNITRHPIHPAWPLKLLTTVIFEDVGGKTKVTLTWEPLDATEAENQTFTNEMESMTQGWGESFDQLAAFLASLSTPIK